MRELLLLENVSKFYGEKLVLRNICHAVSPGQCKTLIGANGAGKSTLLAIMAGLIKPDMGSVKRKEKLNFSFIGHATYIYPGLTAMQNLAFWAKTQNLDLSDKDLRKALDFAQLDSVRDEPAKTFSRGMSQRLNFARALLPNPELLLLDEPFTGLDQNSQKIMRDELVSRRRQGTAIVLISHDPANDCPFADEVLELKHQALTSH